MAHLDESPLKTFDKKYLNKYKIIAGIDEAGRGPLAGPVVCACVILKWPNNLDIIKDSKGLTKKMREYYYEEIYKNALDIKVALVDNEEIDKINILNATKKAVKNVVFSLNVKADYILVDYIPNLILENYNFETIKKGDIQSLSIACASIIAKVYRDRLMEEYDKKYPEYEFIKHHGYPTKRHYELIRKYGPCKVHRKTFKGVLIDKKVKKNIIDL